MWASENPNIHLYFKQIKPGFRSLRTLLYCRKMAKKHAIEVVYERRTTPKIGYALGKLMNVPAIIELNGLPAQEAQMLRGSHRKGISWPVRKRISNHLFRSMNGIVAVTEGIKREIIKSTGGRSEKVFVIQNGANIDLFKPIDKNQCRKKLGLNKNNKYVCFVGNLAPWQGLEYLVRASPIIRKEVPDARFLIVGDGVLFESLQGMAEDIGMREYFHFLGRTPYEQVPEWVNTSDICVAPFIKARNEKIGLSPLKLYEYLACAKPVVASDIEGVGDFLSETNSGIAVRPEDYEDLARGIIELLNDDDRSQRMGENGRDIVTKEHSWDSVAEKVERICRQFT
jgi:glycosyltransferase involved in cell wall biosynthesis